MKGRVLVVDDDTALAEMLGIVLRGEGIEPFFVFDGDKALAAFRETKPDLVLLDLMLPGTDGIDVCRQIRAESGVPIVMLTAKSDTVDVVVGLESGADDYVVKPFKPKELVARLRARLRRTDEPAAETIAIGDLSIDVAGHAVSRSGGQIPLTPLEFDLLVALAKKPRHVFSREVLLEQVWGYRHAADTRLVNVHVQRLRSKVELDPERPEIVVTVRGVGYKARSFPQLRQPRSPKSPASVAAGNPPLATVDSGSSREQHAGRVRACRCSTRIRGAAAGQARPDPGQVEVIGRRGAARRQQRPDPAVQ
jgi:two-component system response regulator MtrA